MWRRWLRPTTTTRGNMLSIYPSHLKEKIWVSLYWYDIFMIGFSYGGGACPIGGSIHLLWYGNVWWDWEGWEGTGFVSNYVSIRSERIILILTFEGDNGSPIGFDRRHHGPSHWLLHPQRSRDHLLPSQVSLILFKWSLPQSSGSSCLSRSPELWCLLSTRDWKTISQGMIRNGETVL